MTFIFEGQPPKVQGFFSNQNKGPRERVTGMDSILSNL